MIDMVEGARLVGEGAVTAEHEPEITDEAALSFLKAFNRKDWSAVDELYAHHCIGWDRAFDLTKAWLESLEGVST